MAIKFMVTEDGERIAVAETEEDFAEALDLGLPVASTLEVVEAFGIPEAAVGYAEWDQACQDEEDLWTTLGTETEQ